MNRLYTAFFCKNTENLAEPRLFLNSICYFWDVVHNYPLQRQLKIALHDKIFLLVYKYLSKRIFLEIPKILYQILASIFLNYILIKRKACSHGGLLGRERLCTRTANDAGFIVGDTLAQTRFADAAYFF